MRLPGIGIGTIFSRFASGSSVDPDAQAFITAAGITDPTQQSAINTLVVDLKAASLWTISKAIYPMVGGGASAHKFNLKDPRDLDAAYRLSFNGGWTHSANGALPNGVNAYADTFYTPSLDSSVTNNNFCLSFYSRTDTAAGTKCSIGALSGGGETDLLLKWAGTLFYPNICENTYGNSVSNTNSQGFYVASRVTTNTIEGYKNGTRVVNVSSTPTAKTNQTIYIGARNAGGAGAYDDKQCAFSHISEGLTLSQVSSLSTIVATFQTTLGRNV